MTDSEKDHVRELVRGLGINAVADLMRIVRKEAEALAAAGELDLGPPPSAGGEALEFLVKQAFRKAGFQVADGPPGLHDGLVQVPDSATVRRPVVLEIKSAKVPTPSREDLRQLDDWVFDLSGETRIRKWGTMSIDEFGPRLTRHKGLLVFNGPLGVPFEQRAADWLDYNEAAFADRHHLCIARLDHILEWCRSAEADEGRRLLFWETIHAAGGALPPPAGARS